MLTIAGGIILAVLILAALPVILTVMFDGLSVISQSFVPMLLGLTAFVIGGILIVAIIGSVLNAFQGDWELLAAFASMTALWSAVIGGLYAIARWELRRTRSNDTRE